MTLKRAHSLVGFSKERAENDYYPSPPEAGEALLRVENFSGNIWEPACGNGVLCEVFKKAGYEVKATDLIDRGYGEGGKDFLWSTDTADNIITNPPFTLAEEFVWKALACTTGKVAMLTKLQFLEGAKRKKMFESTPLKKVYVFSKRLTMTRNGVKMKNSGMIAFQWVLWEHGYKGEPTLGWL